MGKTTKYTERRFLGKTEGFKNKAEERFEQKHLNAYLKGKKTFYHGFSANKNSIGRGTPLLHTVKEEVIENQQLKQLLKAKQKANK